MRDGDLLGGYRVHQLRRALSPRTITRTTSNLWCFARHTPVPLVDVDRDHIEGFLDARNLAPKSRYCWISTIHTFYRWACVEGHVGANPADRVVRPRLARSLPRPAASADIDMAIQMATPRMRCWLALMAYTGLRCQEVSGLERGDILEGLDVPMLHVRHGKGGKDRMVPLHPEVLLFLRSLPMPRAGRLWHVGPKHVSADTNDHLRSLDIDATAHQLRHWFGTSLYRAGRDLRLTQEVMGHSSPVTTALYTAVVVDDAAPLVRSLSLREAMARHHPSSQTPT